MFPNVAESSDTNAWFSQSLTCRHAVILVCCDIQVDLKKQGCEGMRIILISKLFLEDFPNFRT